MSYNSMFGFRTRGRQKLIAETNCPWIIRPNCSYSTVHIRLLDDLVDFLCAHGRGIEKIKHYIVHGITPKGCAGNEIKLPFRDCEWSAYEQAYKGIRQTIFSRFRECFVGGVTFVTAKNKRLTMMPYCRHVFLFDADRMHLEVYAYNDVMYGGSNKVSEGDPKPFPEDDSRVKGQILVVEHDMSWLLSESKDPKVVVSEICSSYEMNMENIRMLKTL